MEKEDTKPRSASRAAIVKLMESSNSESEWNDNCNTVKASCGGYPSWWYQEIIMSGLANRVMANFGRSPDIKVEVL